MGKRAIKDNARITLIDNSNGKKYTTDKKTFEKGVKSLKLRMSAVGLAIGLGVGSMTSPIISSMANKINNSNSTKQAIEMAASTEDYLAKVKSDPILQAAISAERVQALEKLELLINDYKQLKHKNDRTYEERYLEACQAICNSKELVIETYTNTIKAKVAQAYGITEPEKINQIEIKDPITTSSTDGLMHNPNIKLPDGTFIVKDYFLNPNKGMDSTLAKNIIKARALIDERQFSDSTKIDELPIENIIETFEDAKNFEKEYKLNVDENGNIKTEKIEQNKQVDEHDR